MSFELVRARTAGQRHLLPLLLQYLVPSLLLLPLSRSASPSTVVTHLPGFHGPLPFYLETGYVGVEEETGTELFYYFVESERSPGTDPVILWLTGGPGCSGFSGMVFEVGNKERRQPEINLKGYLVGIPITGSAFADFNSKIPYAHGVGIISDQLYEAAMANCEGDYVTPVTKMCVGVLNTIQNLISEVDEGYILDDRCVRAAPKPVKDDASRSRFLSEEQIQPTESSAHPTINCFSYRYYLSNIWANYNRTRDALRIKKGTVGKWVRCINGFPYTYDVPSSIGYQFNLTTRGYRALVFSGDHDLLVPFLGTQAWIRSLNFSIVDDWRAWHVDGQSAGLSYLTLILQIVPSSSSSSSLSLSLPLF